jgi:hypothetical protein
MKIASTIARYLLALILIVFGLNGFLHFLPQQPPPSELARQYCISLPGVCFHPATDRGRTVSLSANRSAGTDHRWAIDRQHSALPCPDGPPRPCPRPGGNGPLVRYLLAVPRGFRRNFLLRSTTSGSERVRSLRLVNDGLFEPSREAYSLEHYNAGRRICRVSHVRKLKPSVRPT